MLPSCVKIKKNRREEESEGESDENSTRPKRSQRSRTLSHSALPNFRKMKIILQSKSGSKYDIDVDLSWTTWQLRGEIEREHGLPAGQFWLIYGGKTMINSRNLKSYLGDPPDEGAVVFLMWLCFGRKDRRFAKFADFPGIQGPESSSVVYLPIEGQFKERHNHLMG